MKFPARLPIGACGSSGAAPIRRPPVRVRASAAEATAARSAAGVPSTRRGSRGSVTVNLRAVPDPALDLDRAAVHVDDRAHDREPEPAAAAARLVRPRAAVEALEDVRQLGRRRCRRRCRRPRSGPRPAWRATSTATDPPRGVNLIALPTRLATTWPIRCGSWRIRIGASGRCSVEVDAATPGAPRVLCSTADLDRRPQVVGPQVEQDQPGVELRELEQVLGEPVEPLDLLAARLEELGAGLRVVRGALLEQLVERAQGRERRPQLVRDVGQEVAAPVAVAADDLDALLEPVGHRVELDRELGQLGRAGPDLVGRDALARGRPRPGRARPRSGGAAAS